MITEIGKDIEKAAGLLRMGEVTAIPTETVYGLAANALDENAVLKIYQIKKRPSFNPLIVHVASFEQALHFTKELPLQAQELAGYFWPGPLTLLLTKNNLIPDLVTAGSSRVAVRVPNHPVTLSLLRLLDFPVAAPSANPSGYVSPTEAIHVYENLQGKIPYILDGGACSVGVESTILGWNKEGQPEIYRPGGIATEELEQVLHQKIEVKKSIAENPDTPGQLKSHYATNTPLFMGALEELIQKFNGKKTVLIRFSNYSPLVPKEQQLLLAPSGTMEEAARNLFRVLREADAFKADVLIAEQVPNEGLGTAINDRLKRAQFIFK
jgi:L-threonylcarbamoyladenylate synthase